MIEVELKFKIDQEQAMEIQKKAVTIEFNPEGKRTYEKTTMFDNAAGLMQKTNGRIRLRRSGETYELCYKKPLETTDGIKKEIEHEVKVADYEICKKIIESMEFHPTTSYERYRTTLTRKSDNTKITIDEYPFATFIEIEGEETAIIATAKEFGLDMKNNLVKPCDTLFTEWREKRGLPAKPYMQFSDFNR